MDPFAVIALGALAGLVLALALAARPRAAAGEVGDGPRAAAEPREDLDGMLDALNARRRRRGEAELTADAIRRGRP